MRTWRQILLVVSMVLVLPLSAYAQASIAGVVKDASGAVLPGVTVEATSPVLIEKARTVVTDEAGQYRIVDLRAGAYTVSFALGGFSTVRREGIELTGSFTAVVNADLKVGALAETITVSGETPIVDTQSVRRQTTISGDLITAVPSARSYAGLMTLMPNTVVATGAASDVQVVPGMVVFGGAGGRSNEGRLQLDGISVGSAFNGGGVSAYIADVGNAQEVALTTSGGLGEAEVGGPSLNVVPKTGGNTVKGSVYLSGVTEGMIGSNYTDDLKARGLSTPGSNTKIWDFNGAVGGPIRKDRLWFFYTLRDEGSHRTVPNMFANLNAGDPTKWTYAADRNRPAAVAASFRTTSLRLTSQATPRNQFRLFWDEQMPCEGAAWPGTTGTACRQSGDNEIIAGGTAAPTPAASATLAPETAAYRDYGTRFRQLSWQSPMTSHVLLEAGVGNYASRYLGTPMPGTPALDFIQVTEQCAAGCAANGGIPNLVYRAGTQGTSWQSSNNWRASLSYVGGKHSMKFGYQGGYLMDDRFPYTNSQFVTYRMNNGKPDQINEIIDYNLIQQRVRYDAYYAQDQWTRGRITLQGALRFDRATSIFPAATIGGVRFLPTVTSFPETKGVDSYKDLTPRGGVAIDLFGDGKTALKFNIGRYLEAAQNGGLFIASRPTSRISTTASRTWTDANANFRPDCDLSNNAAQDLRAGGGDFCGAVANTNFGKSVFDTTQDPALFNGWGVRSGDWQWGASIQRQVAPRVSVEVSYLRRWLLNFVVTDNLAIAPGNFDPFTVTAPVDARLPNGGGYAVPGPLYNVNPSKASVPANNFVTLDTNYGGQSQTSNAIALNLSARPRNGLVIQGGFNTNDTSFDYCSIRAAMPELTIVIGPPTTSPTNPYCGYSTGWVTRYTALGSYTLPKIDVLIGGTVRSDQGGVLAANWAAPNSAIAPSLGRNLSNNAPSATVNLITPGTLYGDRVNEFDLRLAKIIRIGRVRTNVGVDVYNMFNSAPVLTYNQAFVPATATSAGSWLQPTSVLQARFFKVSAQIDF
jgi:Carboxypeptidase regulatory-like domain